VILRKVFVRAEIWSDGRVGWNALRKTFAHKVYEASGRDLMFVRAAMGYCDVLWSYTFLDLANEAAAAVILRGD
jgi:hypothetical protein